MYIAKFDLYALVTNIINKLKLYLPTGMQTQIFNENPGYIFINLNRLFK